jgi:hypothetical protein
LHTEWNDFKLLNFKKIVKKKNLKFLTWEIFTHLQKWKN